MTSPNKIVGRAMFILLATAALAAADTTRPLPGTVNYVEGQVTLNGENLPAPNAGPVAVETNQVLDTAQGKAELLLSPGVFLRLGEDAELRMVSSGAPAIAVEMVRGDSILEVDQLLKGVGLSILMDGSTTDIAKQGLYVFGGDQRFIGVLDGEAIVHQGSAHVTLKKAHGAMLLSGKPLKSQKLDLALTESHPLYIWSELRSAYLAQANIQAAQDILAFGGSYDEGWYWDASLDCFDFVPVDGIFYSSFGGSFYSPVTVSKAPPHPIRHPLPVHAPITKTLSASLSRATSGRAPAAPARSGGGSNSGHTGGSFGGGGGGHMGGGGRR
ncbi:MAG: hypothetical protein ABSH32_25305 [Bryobacteraceae bacterium]